MSDLVGKPEDRFSRVAAHIKWSFDFQVEQHPNATTMMNVAKNLRLERDKEKKLAEQRQEQITLVG